MIATCSIVVSYTQNRFNIINFCKYQTKCNLSNIITDKVNFLYLHSKNKIKQTHVYEFFKERKFTTFRIIQILFYLWLIVLSFLTILFCHILLEINRNWSCLISVNFFNIFLGVCAYNRYIYKVHDKNVSFFSRI